MIKMDLQNIFYLVVITLIVLYVIANVVGGILAYKEYKKMKNEFDTPKKKLSD